MSEENIRTQITLPRELKLQVEEQAAIYGESLAEYLRKAAVLRLEKDQQGLARRKKIADQVIGSLDLSKHPEWKDLESINAYVRELRRERQ